MLIKSKSLLFKFHESNLTCRLSVLEDFYFLFTFHFVYILLYLAPPWTKPNECLDIFDIFDIFWMFFFQILVSFHLVVNFCF